MNDKHITDILDNTRLGSLTQSELRDIRAHVETCNDCALAFEAAQLSALLIRERTNEAAEAAGNFNPFFQTRVLAAWREQQTTTRVPAFRRLWNATAALVASMAVTTAALAMLTFVGPSSYMTNQPTAAVVPYSAENVVLDQDQDDNQMTDDQVINAVYVDDDEGK